MTSLSTSSKLSWPSMLLLTTVLTTIVASIWQPNKWGQAGLTTVALTAVAIQQKGLQRQQHMRRYWHVNVISILAKHSRT